VEGTEARKERVGKEIVGRKGKEGRDQGNK
jgi:hypothetical protein